MEQVDHTAEARRIIHESTHDENGPVPFDLMEDHELAEYHASMVEAQAHATLALVEQQRIANLIAFLATRAPGVTTQRQIADQVRVALGLNGGA